jgi:hypothetical protein
MTAADSSLKAEARRLEIFTTVALWIVVVSIFVRYVLYPVLHSVQGSGFDVEKFDVTARILITGLPAVVLLGAIDAARKLFSRIARGEMFTDAVGQGVRGIGQSLLAAAIATAVVVPWLQSWVEGTYGFGGIRLDALTWTLGVVGFAVMMVGRLLKRAGAMQDELERFV